MLIGPVSMRRTFCRGTIELLVPLKTPVQEHSVATTNRAGTYHEDIWEEPVHP